MEERQETNQDVFLPWKKDKKQTRMYFCHGRKTKNNDGDGKYRQHSTPNGLGTST